MFQKCRNSFFALTSDKFSHNILYLSHFHYFKSIRKRVQSHLHKTFFYLLVMIMKNRLDRFTLPKNCCFVMFDTSLQLNVKLNHLKLVYTSLSLSIYIYIYIYILGNKFIAIIKLYCLSMMLKENKLDHFYNDKNLAIWFYFRSSLFQHVK